MKDHEYKDWIGESPVSILETLVFVRPVPNPKPGTEPEQLPYEDYDGLDIYLPYRTKNIDYKVYRLGDSEKGKGDYVRMVLIGSEWDKDFKDAVEALRFTRGPYANKLVANVPIKHTIGRWEMMEKMELIRMSEHKFSAKLMFKDTKQVGRNHEYIGAFWCWPDG